MNKRERSRIEQSIKELSSKIAALQARAEPVAELLGVLHDAMADLDKRLTIYQSLLVVEDEVSGQPMALSADVRAGIDSFLTSTNEPSITVTSPDAVTQAFVEAIGEKARELDDKAAVAFAEQSAAIHGKDDVPTVEARTFQEDLAAIEAEEAKELEAALRTLIEMIGISGKAGPMLQTLQRQYPQYDIADMVNAMRSHDGRFTVIKVGSLKTR